MEGNDGGVPFWDTFADDAAAKGEATGCCRTDVHGIFIHNSASCYYIGGFKLFHHIIANKMFL